MVRGVGFQQFIETFKHGVENRLELHDKQKLIIGGFADRIKQMYEEDILNREFQILICTHDIMELKENNYQSYKILEQENNNKVNGSVIEKMRNEHKEEKDKLKEEISKIKKERDSYYKAFMKAKESYESKVRVVSENKKGVRNEEERK